MEFHHIIPHDGDMDGETEGNEDLPTVPDPPIWSEVLFSPEFLSCIQAQKVPICSILEYVLGLNYDLLLI